MNWKVALSIKFSAVSVPSVQLTEQMRVSCSYIVVHRPDTISFQPRLERV